MELSDDDSPLDLGDDLVEESLLLESTAGGENEKINLKICFENDYQLDNTITLVKMETDQGEEVKMESATDQSCTQPKVRFDPGPLENLSKKKGYKNRAGEFKTGIDVSITDASQRRKDRAQWFGEAIGDDLEDSHNVDLLLQSLDVEKEDPNIRFNAILLRGVSQMATADIFKYLCKFPPLDLEWIDGATCVAVYSDSTSACQSLLHMSKPIKQCLSGKKMKRKLKPKPALEPMEDDDFIDLNDDIDTCNFISTLERAIGIPEEPETMESESEDEELYQSAVDLKAEQIPTGTWRLAEEYSKSRTLFLRFATKTDIKILGAKPKSDYSKTHGNPNYGGRTGVISSSRKSKLKEAEERALEEEARMAIRGRQAVKYEVDDLFGGAYEEESEPSRPARPKRSEKSLRSSESNVREEKQASEIQEDKEFEAEVHDLLGAVIGAKKRPAMKMHADIEEEKIKSRRLETRARMDQIDVRKRIDRVRNEKSILLYKRVIKEQTKPDLRSRLKRQNT